MSKKTSKVHQSEQKGYDEGYQTGLSRGYSRGIEDALIVIDHILTDNGINMEQSEFFIEMELLKEEGVLKNDIVN
jgi:flagellar biosynthesis/type III secretory pathway protein FliH